jgi:4-hydroxythreonine-4-phosphate dehydrogenase
VIFGDRRILEVGAKVAGVPLDLDIVESVETLPDRPGRPVMVDLRHLGPEEVTPATASLAGGRFATENFCRALLFAKEARAGTVFFTPFNKKAMRLAYPGYDDEIRFIRDVLQSAAPTSEFNVLDKLWNARVTLHILLSGVASAITQDAILRSLALTDAAMRAAGFERPRIAVAALNHMPVTAAISAARRST